MSRQLGKSVILEIFKAGTLGGGYIQLHRHMLLL